MHRLRVASIGRGEHLRWGATIQHVECRRIHELSAPLQELVARHTCETVLDVERQALHASHAPGRRAGPALLTYRNQGS